MALTFLILCTGNSARSIMGEAIVNHLGGDRLRAVSAGSHPKDAPHPQALARIAAEGWSTEGYASKSWDVFAGPAAPRIDVAITVCDSAAAETCPFFSGAPVRVHWGLPDPADAAPEDQDRAFDAAFRALVARVEAALALPLERMSPTERQHALARIGEPAA